MAENKKGPTPPYGSFKSAKSFVERLKKTVLPDAIDRSMMSMMSGFTQSEVLGAFRFLGLVDAEDRTQEPLRALVKAYGTKDWTTALGGVVHRAYKPILDGLNVNTGTAKALADAFKNKAHLDGRMLTRAVQFYLAALKEAEISHSPLFKAPPRTKRNKGNGAANGVKATASKAHKLADPPEEPPEKGTVRYPLYFKDKPAGILVVPQNLSESDCAVIALQIEVLKAYAAQK